MPRPDTTSHRVCTADGRGERVPTATSAKRLAAITIRTAKKVSGPASRVA